MRILLVSGLPRAGKTTFALAFEKHRREFSHLPLDKYIQPIPEGLDFLTWVAGPDCIDWRLLDEHLHLLTSGHPCHPPSPDWTRRGIRRDAGGITGSTSPVPPTTGCIIPGCHAFSFASIGHAVTRLFVKTPRGVIAQRLAGGDRAGTPDSILDDRLSANWREIESWDQHADLVIPGNSERSVQLALADGKVPA